MTFGRDGRNFKKEKNQMATKKTTNEKKTRVRKSKAATIKKRVTADMLKQRIIELEGQLLDSRNEYGKLFEQFTNFRLKINTMLGQILKGLFIVGIDPDVIMNKCKQMFQKKIQAD